MVRRGLPITLLLSSCTDRAACGQLATRPQRPGRGDHDTSSQHRDEDPLPPTAAAPRHTGVLVASRSRASRRVGFGLACGGTLRGRPARCLRRLVRRPVRRPGLAFPQLRGSHARAEPPDHQRRRTNRRRCRRPTVLDSARRTQLRCRLRLDDRIPHRKRWRTTEGDRVGALPSPRGPGLPHSGRGRHGGVWLVGPHRAHGDGQSVRYRAQTLGDVRSCDANVGRQLAPRRTRYRPLSRRR